MTKYANEIYQLINNAHQHYTAENIYQLLKEDNSKIVLASVYNNLNSLVEKGNIRRFTVDGINYYDKVSPHGHLICKCCGEVKDAFANEDFILQIPNKEIDHYELKLFYVCPKCKKGMN